MTSTSRLQNTILHGDCLSALKMVPDACIQCCVTSPPYYGLRSYLSPEHPDKPQEIGLEESPAEYVERLVAVFREVRRVLRSDGVLWLNLGDTYASDRKWEEIVGEKRVEDLHGENPTPHRRCIGLKRKDLIGIPWRVAFALQDDGWWLRSDCIWQKPTAMPEPVTDRPTKSHEYLFLLAKSERYFYDADAIREPLRPKTLTTFGSKHRPQGNDALGRVKSDNWGSTVMERQPRCTVDGEVAGANKRTVWTVSAHHYAEAHFATFPPKLVEPCILSGSSPKACVQCGASWTRVTEHLAMMKHSGLSAGGYGSRTTDDLSGTMLATAQTHTIGWRPTCLCTNNTGTGKCIILDPFMGAGTVALVALQLGRNFLGIELNKDYIELANKRIAAVQPRLWADGGAGV